MSKQLFCFAIPRTVEFASTAMSKRIPILIRLQNNLIHLIAV